MHKPLFKNRQISEMKLECRPRITLMQFCEGRLVHTMTVQYLDTEMPQNNNKQQHKKNPADSGVSDML
jgi:hypothetical protein